MLMLFDLYFSYLLLDDVVDMCVQILGEFGGLGIEVI